MKKTLKLVLAFLAVLGIIVVSQKLSEYVESTQVVSEEISVVIDAGHGGCELRQN